MELNPNAAAGGGVDKEIDENGKETKCQEWASQGECEKNPRYMLVHCAASCHSRSKVMVHLYDGEDVGIAAFRFAEEHSSRFQSSTETQERIGLVSTKGRICIQKPGTMSRAAK